MRVGAGRSSGSPNPSMNFNADLPKAMTALHPVREQAPSTVTRRTSQAGPQALVNATERGG